MSEWLAIYKKAQSDNLCSQNNLHKIRRALENGHIFGFYHRPHSGGPGEEWAFQTFDQFMSYLAAKARPGDLYIIWSLKELLDKGLELARARYDGSLKTGAFMLSPEQMQIVKDYLAPKEQKGFLHYPEALTLFYLPEPGMLEISIDDLDSYDEDMMERTREYSRPGGEIYVFPYETIESLEHILLAAAYR